MDLNHEQKLSLLHQLIRIAGADGEHRDEEYDMLHVVAQHLQVEPMDMESLFSVRVDDQPPKEESRRIVVFYHMLRMVWADGEFDPDEEVLLSELGAKLGLRLQAIDTTIMRSKIYPNGNIPESEFLQIFLLHHN